MIMIIPKLAFSQVLIPEMSFFALDGFRDFNVATLNSGRNMT